MRVPSGDQAAYVHWVKLIGVAIGGPVPHALSTCRSTNGLCSTGSIVSNAIFVPLGDQVGSCPTPLASAAGVPLPFALTTQICSPREYAILVPSGDHVGCCPTAAIDTGVPVVPSDATAKTPVAPWELGVRSNAIFVPSRDQIGSVR